MPRTRGDPDAPRLSDHCRSSARSLSRRVGPRSTNDRRSRDRPETSDDFTSQVKQATLQRYADDLQGVPYVAEAVAAIGLPKCVASSGTPKNSPWPHLPASTTFSRRIFSPQAKSDAASPRPTCFCSPPSRCGHCPTCVVIEDSVPGITGARAAGMAVLGFHGGSHCRPGYADTLRAAGAAATFDDMRELAGLIGELRIPRRPAKSDP